MQECINTDQQPEHDAFKNRMKPNSLAIISKPVELEDTATPVFVVAFTILQIPKESQKTHAIKKNLKMVDEHSQITLIEKVRKTMLKYPNGINTILGVKCPIGSHTASMPIQNIRIQLMRWK